MYVKELTDLDHGGTLEAGINKTGLTISRLRLAFIQSWFWHWDQDFYLVWKARPRHKLFSESQRLDWDKDFFCQVLRSRLPLVSKSRLRPKFFKDSYGHGPLESFLVSYGASSVFKRYCNVPTLQWLQLKRVPLLKMSLYEISTYCSSPCFCRLHLPSNLAFFLD